PEKPKLHRPRSKIARLPPPVRQRLNLLIDEGITYAEVITGLGPEGSHLTEQDVCRWYKNGFQDWIRNQIWLENTRSRLDMATDVIAEHDGPNVHLANLHIAATQLIHDLTAKGETLLAENPEAYVTVVNSIARLAREALNFQKYREACALARIELDKLRDPARKLTHEETLAIVDHLDRILGFK
ncbi:MAG TPA: hypothetical protein VG167_04000, partial [Verrucomicrobiae bacterium]|nr:hypothetical protein [Verrucomicrobiae bacterium]